MFLIQFLMFRDNLSLVNTDCYLRLWEYRNVCELRSKRAQLEFKEYICNEAIC